MGSAVFSPCGTYRYTLERELSHSLFNNRGLIVWVALNPSVATETVNDNTIRREIGFSERWGYSRMRKLNLFALRSTDPQALIGHPDPVGPENDRHIVEGVADANLIVVAWGSFESEGRAAKVLELLKGRELFCLGTNADSQPKHPLYLSSYTELVPYIPPTPKVETFALEMST
jgi:hypothetical protein